MAEPKNEMQYPGKKNFKGPSGSKSESKPHGGSPWAYGRPSGAEHTRTASSAGTSKPSLKKPSASVSKPLYAGNKDRSGI